MASAIETTRKMASTSRTRKLRATARTTRIRALPSALGEGVPGAPDREDERGVARVVLELLAQVAHMDVDGLLVLVQRLVVAHQLQQLAAREDPAGTRREVAQDLELGGRERDAPGAPLDPPPLEVDDQVLVADLPAT